VAGCWYQLRPCRYQSLAVEFNQPDLSDDIIRILSLATVPAKHFEIEVIEKVLLDGRSGLVSDALEKLHQ
jgi:EAL domain-containing protein (putative c-di-GMP-specific phosphodiesterase class I)